MGWTGWFNGVTWLLCGGGCITGDKPGGNSTKPCGGTSATGKPTGCDTPTPTGCIAAWAARASCSAMSPKRSNDIPDGVRVPWTTVKFDFGVEGIGGSEGAGIGGVSNGTSATPPTAECDDLGVVGMGISTGPLKPKLSLIATCSMWSWCASASWACCLACLCSASHSRILAASNSLCNLNISCSLRWMASDWSLMCWSLLSISPLTVPSNWLALLCKSCCDAWMLAIASCL